MQSATLLATVVLTATMAACSSGDDSCTPDLGGASSVARVWNEVNLEAIRVDFPAPTVHARNLFHLSAAMWDAWAAYEPAATGYLVADEHEAADVGAARRIAISQAASTILRERYSDTSGTEETLEQVDEALDRLCLPVSDDDDPEAVEAGDLGDSIAAAYLELGASDGSNEAERYVDDTYAPVNPPLAPARSGTLMDDPDRWQALDLNRSIGQNGVPLPDGVQIFVGSQWGSVTPFRAARRSPRRAAGRPGSAALPGRSRHRRGLPAVGPRGDPVQQPPRSPRCRRHRHLAGSAG